MLKSENRLARLGQMVVMLIVPFSFIINIYFFLILIIALFACFWVDTGSAQNKFLIIYLLSFQFSGIKIFQIHLYDIMLLLLLGYVVFQLKGKIKIKKGIQIFLLMIVLVCTYMHSMTNEAMADLIRYITAFVTFITIYNLKIDFEYCQIKINELILFNIYNAVVVFILYSNGFLKNVSTGLISTEIYLYKEEIRLNGFFSDPNKYLTYGMILLCILSMSEINKRMMMITVAGMVISMSRSSLICVAVYIFFNIRKKIKQQMQMKSRIIFDLLIIIIVSVTVYILFATDVIDFLFNGLAVLLGRSRAVELSTSLSGDNRVLIWKRAVELIIKRPIIGYGLDILEIKEFFPYPTHNTILCLLVKGGIVLFAVYAYFFKDMFKKLNAEIISFFILPLFFLDLDSYRLYFLMYAILLKYSNNIQLIGEK